MKLQGKSVLILPDDNDELSKGGIHIKDTKQEKPKTGTVIDIGIGCEYVKKGDKVFYNRREASIQVIDEKEYHFVGNENEQIFMIIENN